MVFIYEHKCNLNLVTSLYRSLNYFMFLYVNTTIDVKYDAASNIFLHPLNKI